MTNHFDLTGKVALVTGGSRGLGAQMVMLVGVLQVMEFILVHLGVVPLDKVTTVVAVQVVRVVTQMVVVEVVLEVSVEMLQIPLQLEQVV